MWQGVTKMQGGVARRGEGGEAQRMRGGAGRCGKARRRCREGQRGTTEACAVLGLFWVCLGVICMLNEVIMERWPLTMIFWWLVAWLLRVLCGYGNSFKVVELCFTCLLGTHLGSWLLHERRGKVVVDFFNYF